MIRKLATYVTAGVVGAGVLAATQAMSQEGRQDRDPGMSNFEQMEKLYQELGTPGPEHAWLQESAGTWQTENKSWWVPGEPQVFSGVSQIEPIFGGRFVKERFQCTWEGKPYEGMGLRGYDKLKKKYVAIWLDNHSTGIAMTEGEYDEAGKTLTMMGKHDDPIMGPMKIRNVIREESKDKTVFEMYKIGADGQERKAMEVTYTRSAS